MPSPILELGTPHELFRGPFLADLYGDRSYDVMPDGAHFLMFEANPATAPELRVVRNWAAEVKSPPWNGADMRRTRSGRHDATAGTREDETDYSSP